MALVSIVSLKLDPWALISNHPSFTRGSYYMVGLFGLNCILKNSKLGKF